MDEDLLIPVEDDEGVQRFDPEEVDALKMQLKAGVDTPEMLASASGMVEAGSGMLKGIEKHVENLLRLVVDPSHALLEQMGDENVKLRERCDQLEDKLSAMLENMEEILQKKHERSLETMREQASLKRKDMGAKMFLNYAPILLGQMMSKGKKMDPQAAALLSIIHSLDAEKLILLKSTGFIPPDQFEQLKTMLTPEQLIELKKIEDVMEAQAEAGDNDEESEDDAEGESGEETPAAEGDAEGEKKPSPNTK